MNVDSIKNGFVIDHIKAGKGMEIYNLLNLGNLGVSVALITNAVSKKNGKKDINIILTFCIAMTKTIVLM